jgi:hypothetical protein
MAKCRAAARERRRSPVGDLRERSRLLVCRLRHGDRLVAGPRSRSVRGGVALDREPRPPRGRERHHLGAVHHGSARENTADLDVHETCVEIDSEQRCPRMLSIRIEQQAMATRKADDRVVQLEPVAFVLERECGGLVDADHVGALDVEGGSSAGGSARRSLATRRRRSQPVAGADHRDVGREVVAHRDVDRTRPDHGDTVPPG